MRAAAEAAGWTAGGRVRVLQAGRNGGFGAGNNAGIRAGLAGGAAPDYVYLLNSDAFPDPGAIRALLDHLEAHPAVGLAGSYIHGPDGEPHLTAFRFPSLWSELEGAARTGPITRLLARHVVPLPIPSDRHAGRLAGRRERDDAHGACSTRSGSSTSASFSTSRRPTSAGGRRPPAGRPSTCARARSPTSARSPPG